MKEDVDTNAVDVISNILTFFDKNEEISIDNRQGAVYNEADGR